MFSAKVDIWYKFKKKCGVENMLEFCGGLINIKKNRGDAIIIFLIFIILVDLNVWLKKINGWWDILEIVKG